MPPENTDKDWEYYGRTDPYYGVLISDSYRTSNITDDARVEFFSSGDRYIELVMDLIHENIDPSFQPVNALDFGCGVGRLVPPLARICTSVTGVDVSDSMIAEASNNCKEQGISNVMFIKGDDTLSSVYDTFDFINSFIVFQHIPPKRGIELLPHLIERLQPQGIGVLHFTYFSKETWGKKLLISAYKAFPFLWKIRAFLKCKPKNEPMIQMNEYNLNRILKILQETGCHRIQIRFTDHGMYGVIILFQKQPLVIL